MISPPESKDRIFESIHISVLSKKKNKKIKIKINHTQEIRKFNIDPSSSSLLLNFPSQSQLQRPGDKIGIRFTLIFPNTHSQSRKKTSHLTLHTHDQESSHSSLLSVPLLPNLSNDSQTSQNPDLTTSTQILRATHSFIHSFSFLLAFPSRSSLLFSSLRLTNYFVSLSHHSPFTILFFYPLIHHHHHHHRKFVPSPSPPISPSPIYPILSYQFTYAITTSLYLNLPS